MTRKPSDDDGFAADNSDFEVSTPEDGLVWSQESADRADIETRTTGD